MTAYSAADEGEFDFVFVNSLMHHLETALVRRLLSRLATLLTNDGHIHILDLVLPAERFSISRMMARADRGDYPRPLNEWRELFAETFEVVELELGLGGVTLWNTVYCKGRASRPA